MSDTGALAYVVAALLIGFALIAGIVKCWSISRRPRTNRKCVSALMLMLIAWFLSTETSSISRLIPIPLPLDLILQLVSFAVIIGATILAISGLREYSRERGFYTQGKAQAIWALVFSGVNIAMFIFAMVIVVKAVTADRTNSPLFKSPLVFQELNFRFREPGSPWVKMETNSLDSHATVAFTRKRPDAQFLIVTQRAPQENYSAEDLAELAIQNLRSAINGAQVTFRGPTRLRQLEGLRLDSRAERSGQKFYYQYRLFTHNGWAYQLIAWGGARDEQLVAEAANDLAWGFEMLDYRRQAHSETNSAAGKTP
jgi:hypothetical protein